MHQFTRRLTAGSAAAALAVVGFASPAMADHTAEPPPGGYGSAGDATIVVPVNDSEAGGTYYQPFERVYAATTDEYVHAHPWHAVGVGALAGALLGFLIARR